MKHSFFVTAIGTDVGKTIFSAILTEALQADYWKPIQAGSLYHTDTDTVKELISNTKSIFHSSAYALHEPMSPHAAAKVDNITIELSNIQEPRTDNHLVTEGAGGLLVPLNTSSCVADLITDKHQTILVVKHYLGSINHTLLSLEYLRQKGITNNWVVINGERNIESENALINIGRAKIIHHFPTLNTLTKETILYEASKLKQKIAQFLK